MCLVASLLGKNLWDIALAIAALMGGVGNGEKSRWTTDRQVHLNRHRDAGLLPNRIFRYIWHSCFEAGRSQPAIGKMLTALVRFLGFAWERC